MALIVVADDDPGLRELMARALRRRGHEVILAADGAEAVSAAIQYAPDAVLLDGSMPNITGYEACRVLRSRPQTAQIAVLLVSGSYAPVDVEEYLQYFTAIVSKPFLGAELVAQVDAAISAAQAVR
jgi:CheY-like chemotaxis protein